MEYLSITLLAAFAILSPGPDFALVTQNTLSQSKKVGLYTGLGITASNIFHATYSLFGLSIIMANSIYFFSIIKFLGAAYLIFLGLKTLLKNANSKDLSTKTLNTEGSCRKAFWQGFLSNALNPKAALLFLSIFTVFITPGTPLLIQITIGILIALGNLIWYSFVSITLATKRVSEFLSRMEGTLSKVMGCSLIIFGIHLIFLKQKSI